MKQVFLLSFSIAKNESDHDAGPEPTGVSPVVDSRDHKTKEKKPNDPTHYLPVNSMSVDPPSALSIVQGSANQTANGPGGADTEGYACEVRKPEAEDTSDGVNRDHSVGAIFPCNERAYMVQGNHIEKDVQNPSMEVVCGQQGPPAMESVNRDCPGAA